MNITSFTPTDTEYPPLLREIFNPPTRLYCAGTPPLSTAPYIGIVGTRKAGPYGISIAESFSAALARAGVVIVSGLAIGIDAAAHRGALNAHGVTVAVLPCHPSTVYPRHHERLARSITSSSGALLSEYGADETIYPSKFIARNRIISGLCSAIIVIEAPLPSGALSTARFALEQNREVFVVPGPITGTSFSGSHELIRQGAQLVTSPDDVLAELGLRTASERTGKGSQDAPPTDPAQNTLFSLIQKTGAPISVDKLIELSKLQPHMAHEALAHLIIDGRVSERGGYYTGN